MPQSTDDTVKPTSAQALEAGFQLAALFVDVALLGRQHLDLLLYLGMSTSASPPWVTCSTMACCGPRNCG